MLHNAYDEVQQDVKIIYKVFNLRLFMNIQGLW